MPPRKQFPAPAAADSLPDCPELEPFRDRYPTLTAAQRAKLRRLAGRLGDARVRLEEPPGGRWFPGPDYYPALNGLFALGQSLSPPVALPYVRDDRSAYRLWRGLPDLQAAIDRARRELLGLELAGLAGFPSAFPSAEDCREVLRRLRDCWRRRRPDEPYPAEDAEITDAETALDAVEDVQHAAEAASETPAGRPDAPHERPAPAAAGEGTPPAAESAVQTAGQGGLALAPGGFTYQNKVYDLTGKPSDMLKALLSARHRRCTALGLRKALGVDEQALEWPEQTVKDAARKLRAALVQAAADAGLTCDDPLPSVGKGKDLTYKLSMS